MKREFRDLPEPLKALMAKLSRGEVPADFRIPIRSIPLEGGTWKIVSVLLGLLMAAATVLITINADPVEWIAVPLFGGIILAGCAMTVFNVQRYRALRASRVRPAIIASPVLMALTGLDDEPIFMHYHKDLKTPQITHHHTNGAYTYTSFSMVYETGSLSFSINNRKRAEDLLQYLKDSGEVLQQWINKGTFEDHIQLVDWISIAATAETSARIIAPPNAFLHTALGKCAVSLAAALIFTGLTGSGNLVQNELSLWSRSCSGNAPENYATYLTLSRLKWHREEAMQRWDDTTFRDAKASQTAGALREYVKKFSQGKHVAEAREEIRTLYKKAEEAYLAKSAKAIPEAHEGMKALLAHLREQDTPIVNICFAPSEGTDGKEFEEQIRQETGSSKIHPLGPSFSAEANRGRETRIIGVMGASFNKVFSDDLFVLSPSTTDQPGARFLVKYSVVGDTWYTLRSEDSLPEAERQYWVGILIHFSFSLQVPGSLHPPDPSPEKGYAFTMTAKPAPNFTVAGETFSASAVYDRMVETAFQEFEVNLANAYGLELVMPSDWGSIPGVRTDDIPGSGLPINWKFPDLPGWKDLPDSVRLSTLIEDVLKEAEGETPPPTLDTLLARIKERAAQQGSSIQDEEKLKNDVSMKWALRSPHRPPPSETPDD